MAHKCDFVRNPLSAFNCNEKVMKMTSISREQLHQNKWNASASNFEASFYFEPGIFMVWISSLHHKVFTDSSYLHVATYYILCSTYKE